MLRAIIFVVATLAIPAWAQDDSLLRRLTLRSDTLGWEAVGRVDIGRSGYCTGVLLRTDIVLTAAHCLFDSVTGKRVDPTTITFKAGLRDGNSVAERKVKRAVVYEKYRFSDRKRQTRDAMLNQVRYDVALLQLSDPIPTNQAAPFQV